jgi:hypothetical protein
MRFTTFAAIGVAGGMVAYLAAHVERLQRFTTLADTDMLQGRLALSLNMGFFDVLAQYPMGAGLASAWGTSVPYFLMNTTGFHDQIGMENEFGHILVEQGLVGLVLWVSLAVWSTLRERPKSEAVSPTAIGLMRLTPAFRWATAFIGVGLLWSTPTASILFAMMGLNLVRAEPVRRAARRANPVPVPDAPQLGRAPVATRSPVQGFPHARRS